jgi:hypothetical protein
MKPNEADATVSFSLTFHRSPFPVDHSPRISSHSAGFFRIQEEEKLLWNCRKILLSIFQNRIFLVIYPKSRQKKRVQQTG